MSCNCNGLGMYVDYFPCPYDQIVDQFNAIPADQIPQPIDCGCNGMAGLTMDGTGLWGSGLFSGGFDTWGAGEFGVLALGAFALYSIVFTSRRAGEAVRHRAGKISSRAKKIKRGFTS